VAVQGDGKIVAVAGAQGASNFDFFVARYLGTGSPDPMWGGNGTVLTPVGSSSDSAVAVAVQTDGKVVVVGTASVGGGGSDFAVVRYLDNGMLDADFNGTGKVLIDFGGTVDEVAGVAIDELGRIVVAGTAGTGSASDFAVVRLLGTGALDTAFNGTGKALTDFVGLRDTGAGVAVQADGRVVVAGTTVSNTRVDFGVVRYLENGTLDPAFGTGGKATVDIEVRDLLQGDADTAHGVVVEEGGRIIVAGVTEKLTGNGIEAYATLARFRPDGSVDRGFSAGGVQVDVGNSGLSLALQTNGKVVVTTMIRDGADFYDPTHVLVVRYRPNGLFDPLFGTAGKVVLPSNSAASATAVQGDGQIVVAGSRKVFTPPFDLVGEAALVRFVGDAPVVLGDGVLATGTPVEGEQPGTVFVEFGSPTIDVGQLGGTASVQLDSGGKQTVIFGDAEAQVQVRTGGMDAEGGAFTKLGDPVFGAVGEALGFMGSAVTPSQVPRPLLVEPHRMLGDMMGVSRAVPAARVSALFSRFVKGAGVKRLAVQGGSAPGISGARVQKLQSFGVPRDRGGLVYTGNLKRGSGVSARNDFAIWRESDLGGESAPVLRTQQILSFPVTGIGLEAKKLRAFVPVQHATDQRRSFAADGGVAVAGSTDQGRSAVVLVRPDGAESTLGETGQHVSDLPFADGVRFEISQVRAPATAAGGYAAFAATLRAIAGGAPAPSHAVIVNRGDWPRTVLQAGEPLPGNSEQRFASLGDPLLGESGMVAMVAALTGRGVTPGNRKVIVQVRPNNQKSVVARLGEPAADGGTGVTYRKFQSVVVTDTYPGRILFTGTMKGPGVNGSNQQGLWCVGEDGVAKLLMRSGQELTIGATKPRIRLFTTLDAKRANMGQGRTTDATGFVTAKVKLSDGRTGVLRITLP